MGRPNFFLVMTRSSEHTQFVKNHLGIMNWNQYDELKSQQLSTKVDIAMPNK